MGNTLYVAFIWHMHQPYYKNLLTQEIPLPWVRLHGIKDYYDMAAILEKFPEIHQTFNLVPSLIDQLNDYIEDPAKIKDIFLELSAKKATELSSQDKIFILSNFFLANWENMIKPYPRFYELLMKRGEFIGNDFDAIIKKFSTQDFLDLQVWHNLAWFDPMFKENDPGLDFLVKKGQEFSEEDKAIVLNKQFEILAKIIPLYKKMQDRGQIEVTISPYYHPILPLLCNTEIAKASNPKITLPRQFRYPEDARWQVQHAVEHYLKYFQRKPEGMWPAEGAVSEEIIPIIAESGINWIASDEGVLFKTLNKPRTAELLYQPYLINNNGHKMNIIFRDHNLSDLIGFVYARVNPEEATEDFIAHLQKIREHLSGQKEDYLVSIIMDGENAWEFFTRDGWDFLSCLYERLSKEKGIKTTTVNDFLQHNPAKTELKSLFPGSWINTNFNIWIGHEEKNLAWDYLNRARKVLAEYTPKTETERKNLALAWRHIYIAEGSDWNWWYGPDNSSDNLDEFDLLYRTHLSNFYKLIGQEPPPELSFPIRSGEIELEELPHGFLEPIIDGMDTNYFEWMNAGYCDVQDHGGTMHRGESLINAIYFGFSEKMLFLRIDPAAKKENLKDITFEIEFLLPQAKIIIFFEKKKKIEANFCKKNQEGSWQKIKKIKEVALEQILELGVSFADLGVKENDKVKILLKLIKNGKILNIVPHYRPISFLVPGADFDASQWVA